ncbi:hypothetical protein DIE15_08295 [Burkholderia sp. Bp9031]|uniref:hypothetical protein n=1 Tax=Burkholderia sp. Bp9031 TaxID=2184566 RepID=UPI000F5DDE84|nr:hypothetical protein [Burkholderia sp. Bp9031]RQZ18122.1 hypothetical protein DIE15_08295 [Burkholderia sp. Bp9031]
MHADHSAKDFWDVASVLGTWAAVVAALYITTSDRRKRTQDDLLMARLTAASVTYRLGLLKDAVSSVREFAQSKLNGDIYPAHFLMYAHTLQSIEKCSFDELRSLAALPGHTAVQIAGAQDRVDIARAMLDKESISISTLDEQLRSLGIVVTALVEAENLLTHAVRVCERESQAVNESIGSKIHA